MRKKFNFVLTKANVDDRNENLLSAMGAYCFFTVKPEVNFDVEQADGQLVLRD